MCAMCPVRCRRKLTLCRVGVEPVSDQDETRGYGVFKHIFDEDFDEIPLPKDPPPSILGGGVLQLSLIHI